MRCDPGQFVADQNIVDKFEKLVRHVPPEKQMRGLRDAVLDLERFDDTTHMGRLMALH